MPMNNFSSQRNKKIDFRPIEGVAMATASLGIYEFPYQLRITGAFTQNQL